MAIQPNPPRFLAHVACGRFRGSRERLAFCRKTRPVWLGFGPRVIGKIKRTLMSVGGQKAASSMGAG
jgi:hypothetical protein